MLLHMIDQEGVILFLRTHPVPGESYIQQTPTNQDVATASNAMKISVSHDVIATQYIAQTNYKTTKYSTG